MKATDLHIGCHYWSVKWQKPVILTAEDIYELVVRAEGASIDDYIGEMLEPIYLTPDVLDKAGFEKVFSGMQMAGNYDCIKTDVGMITLRPSYEGGYYWFINGDIGQELPGVLPIKYVHTLQNLVHALTGEELSITL